MIYVWLVEEFSPDGSSTGRYMLDRGSLAITYDVYAARRLRREMSAAFSALDMREARRGDWRAVEHGFDDSEPPNGPDERAAQPVAGAVAQPKKCHIVMDEGSSQPESSPRCQTCGEWRSEPCNKAQAAPAPEPSAQAVAHPSHQTVREWMPVSEALRLSDLWTAGDLDNCGQWRAAIKVLADEVRALAASPQPAEPSAQGEPPRFFDLLFELAQTGHISDLGITGEAMRQIRAALAASPQPAEPSAQGEPVAWISPKDRVPKGGEVVLCLFRDKGIHTALFRGTSTTHGVFEAWHGFLVADLPTDRVIGWVPLASAPSTPPPAVVEAVPSLHPATADLVRRFSQALAEKLAAAEAKYGYSDGWASPDWMDECRAKLMEHIAKGDPRDVAAYCAFLWHHGASTAHAREPLNFDRLQSVMAAHFGGRELTDDEADSAEAFARAIERAHGIGA